MLLFWQHLLALLPLEWECGESVKTGRFMSTSSAISYLTIDPVCSSLNALLSQEEFIGKCSLPGPILAVETEQ